MRYIMGINGVYHESSACLVKDGRVVAFVEEERLCRRKHAKPATIENAGQLPLRSIAHCLREAGIGPDEVDHVGFSFDPERRLLRNSGVEDPSVVGDGGWGTPDGERRFYNNVRGVVDSLGQLWGRDLRSCFSFIPHHVCHAAGAFYQSGYQDAAIVVVDGIGEFASTWVGAGDGQGVRNLYEVEYPNSLGFLWEKMSEFLGFDEYSAAKVMGLSSYGCAPELVNSESGPVPVGSGFQAGRLSRTAYDAMSPGITDYESAMKRAQVADLWQQGTLFGEYSEKMRQIACPLSDGTFFVDNTIMRFRSQDFGPLETLFGVPRRQKGQEITEPYVRIAAALQEVTSEILLNVIRQARASTGSDRLCLAGGVALNCAANGKIVESRLFKSIYVPPAANDAGTAVGAALHLWRTLPGGGMPQPLHTAYLGPEYDGRAIEDALRRNCLPFRRVPDISKCAAELLSQGKIVAWFQGKMEAGPRALGHRSILADPRNPNVRQELNSRVKFREAFRPFCPSVLEERAAEWFEVAPEVDPVRYMLVAVNVRRDVAHAIPAVVHVDGTCRIQSVQKSASGRLWSLIDAFRQRTGIPMVLNTSFNIQEPIVCSPDDAISTFRRSALEYLAIGDFLVTKEGSEANT